jgi:CRP-like cAMP-binding protein
VDRATATSARSQSVRTNRRYQTPWSKARLAAAVDATRPRGATANGRLFADEIEFFATDGTRHEVSSGMVLAERGQPARDIHLVEHGAAAVRGAIERHRPILAFTMPDELCGAIPALLRQAAPWDTIAVTDSSVITIPADRFIPVVGDRWADRWSTRTVSWLAEIGARVADLDGNNLTGQVAALLLRHRGGSPVYMRRRTLADLLDVEDSAIRRVLDELRRLGAVRLHGSHVTITRADLLQSTVAAARGQSRPESIEGLPATAVTDSLSPAACYLPDG